MKVYLIVGLFLFLLCGGLLLWLYFRRRKLFAQIEAARRWPEATAVIDQAECREFFDGDVKFKPVLRYRFQAGGHTFAGHRLNLGDVRDGTPSQIKKLLEPYPPGGRTQIRYNPADPRDNVIELRPPPLPMIGPSIVALAAAVGLVLAVMGAAGAGPNVGEGNSSSARR